MDAREVKQLTCYSTGTRVPPPTYLTPGELPCPPSFGGASFILCWPLALLALVLYPIVWLPRIRRMIPAAIH